MSHRYRLTPTPEQETILRDHCAHARFVWNLCVEQQSWWRPGRGSMPGLTEKSRQLTEARAAFGWLRAGSIRVQQSALGDYGRALAAFFNPRNPAAMPGWRKAGRDEGFRIVGPRGGPDWDVRRLSRRVGEVRIPKIGWVRFRWSRNVPEDAKSYRVTLDRSGRWHVIFVSMQPPLDRQPTGAVVGIDRGVRTALVTSDGQHYRAPRVSDRDAGRYLALSRRLRRQHPGSRKREKTRLAMARIAARTTDRRRDWAEKVSTRLVIDHDVIAFEKLNTSGMVRRPKPKPDPDRPGAFAPNKAKAKAGLNRAILGSCWGFLTMRCEQKADASGAEVIYVNPSFTSQECRACGHIARESRESQAVFRCVSCGHADHADANAAKNILARGLVSAGLRAGPGARGVRPRKTAQAAAGTIRAAA